MFSSRHVATSSSELDQRVRTKRPPWQIVGTIACAAAILYLAQLPWTALVALAAAGRIGPMNAVLCMLPEIASRADFENRAYRVCQSMWLVSVCCALYTLIPEEAQQAPLQGWKMNLVTMETSMASGIAATYGYSVAGGVPGGLLSEYVMSVVGKKCVAELSPWVGGKLARAGVSFALFMTMGSYMNALAQTAYAFAHQREHTEPALSPRSPGRAVAPPGGGKEHRE